MDSEKDKILFEKISHHDTNAFSCLFKNYYKHLCVFAAGFLGENDAEEVVQRFFVKLWEKRDKITIETSVKNYLYSSVRNICLNEIKRAKTSKTVLDNLNHPVPDDQPDNIYFEPDFEKKILDTINELPEKRKEIFLLSREKGLKYVEIAEKLQISVKTVEAQMGHALKFMYTKFKDYLD